MLAASTAILGLFIKIATAAGLSLSESFNLSTIVTFLIGTQFGTVWLVRMVLLCLLAAVLSPDLFGWLNRNSAQLCIAGLILSSTLLMSLAVAGHASAAEGVTLLVQIGMDALHLLAAGVWLGGLIPLAMFLNWVKGTHGPSTLLIAQQATARFSRVGFVSVTVLVLTGLFNAWYLVGGIPPLLGTNYGYLLLAKLGILIPLMGLASKNRWRLKPRLSDLANHNEPRENA